MSKRDEAVARMTAECNGKEYLIQFEEYLTRICNSDAIAEKILNPEKTLEGAFEAMKKVAKSRQKNGFAYIPESEGYAIIRKYYEITEESADQARPAVEIQNEPGEIIDIMDLI